LQILNEQDALTRIVRTIRHAAPGEAPFALVLGAGFSHGLVPTTRELVTRSLPLWMTSKDQGVPYKQLASDTSPEESNRIAAQFWKKFEDDNRRYGLKLSFNTQGLPGDNAEAYQAAFNPQFDGAVGAPSDARKFQRALMRLEEPRLNAAHFLLASILGVQPTRSQESKLFKENSALTRLILTTNFDPFLQTALQAVNRLYFMSDTPDLGLADDIFDESTEAIHLVYVHGSVHRRSQKATTEEIAEIKKKNAMTLAPVLKRHGVIVLGYSGWDDAIVDALAACESFDHRLYWCGTRPDPLAKGAYGSRVSEVLNRASACYVKIDSAGRFMAELCTRLVNGLPRLLDNPIGQLREMLEIIDLAELEAPKQPEASVAEPGRLPTSIAEQKTFQQIKQSVIISLKDAEVRFLKPAVPADVEGTVPAAQVTVGSDRVLSSILFAEKLGNHGEVVRLSNEALRETELSAPLRVEMLNLRGRAHLFTGHLDEAFVDFNDVIVSPGGDVEQVAAALLNRGYIQGTRGKLDAAAADYGAVIEKLTPVSADILSQALVNRGLTRGMQGQGADALSDLSRAIGMDGAQSAVVTAALLARGFIYKSIGQAEKALTDWNRVIDSSPSEVPRERVAHAILNRGIFWQESGNLDTALGDFTLVTEMQDASVEQYALALFHRAVVWKMKSESEKAITDLTQVIENLTRAPASTIAASLTNRGALLSEKGDHHGATADFTRIIEMPGAPPALIARAFGDRGWRSYLLHDVGAFLNDTREALARDPLLSAAWFNLGLALLANGLDAEALAAYTRAAIAFQAEIEGTGLPDLRRAVGDWLSPERAKPIVDLLESMKPKPV
jgi:tetratricopeptide (TPR) repeat protein